MDLTDIYRGISHGRSPTTESRKQKPIRKTLIHLFICMYYRTVLPNADIIVPAGGRRRIYCIHLSTVEMSFVAVLGRSKSGVNRKAMFCARCKCRYRSRQSTVNFKILNYAGSLSEIREDAQMRARLMMEWYLSRRGILIFISFESV